MFSKNVSVLQNKMREEKYKERLEAMEKKTIILEPTKRILMYSDDDTYMGSITNVTNQATIEVEYKENVNQYCIDYYFNGAAIHFWCHRYEVEQ